MIQRTCLFLVLLAVAAIGPMVFLQGGPQAISKGWNSLWNARTPADDWLAKIESGQFQPGQLEGNPFGIGSSAGLPPLGGSGQFAGGFEGPLNLEDVFRFDLTPPQVASRWPNVTVVRNEPDWHGLRAPLTTGIAPDDLAGVITYYFDQQHRLQRIEFQGTTADPRKLISHVVQRHGFQQAPQLGSTVYATQWNGEPRSALVVGHVPSLGASSVPIQRLPQVNLQLEINNSLGDDYRMSREMLAQVKPARPKLKWWQSYRRPDPQEQTVEELAGAGAARTSEPAATSVGKPLSTNAGSSSLGGSQNFRGPAIWKRESLTRPPMP